MKRLTCVATLALSAASLFAGTRIRTETTDLAANTTTTDTILLDATRIRMDTDKNTVVMFLTDGGRNRMVLLDKAKNEYREIDEQTMNQLAAQMSGMMAQLQAQTKNMTPEQRKMMEQVMKGKMPQAAAEAPKTVYTAKGSGSINGFSCSKYDGVRSGEKIAEVCAALPAQLKLTASDMQVFEKMKQFSSSLQGALSNSPLRVNVQSSSAFEAGYDGFPVQKVDFQDGKASKRSEVKSVTPASFTDADFSLGSAKKVELPIPGARAK